MIVGTNQLLIDLSLGTVIISQIHPFEQRTYKLLLFTNDFMW